jgi:ubiquinone biosynthesis protein
MNKIYKTIGFGLETRNKFKSNKKVTKQDGLWLRNKLQEMGPTYIKIGQFMSSRRDIFDKNIVDSLKELQDNVKPIKDTDIKNIIGNSINIEHFSKIEKIPLASASIGQVHKGYLKRTNTCCAIKIKRPNVLKQIESDLDIIYRVLELMKYCKVENIDETVILMDEFKDFIIKEADYEHELANIDLYTSIYSNNNDILLPQIYKKATTSNAIVMSFIPSIKLAEIKNHLSKEKKSEIAYRLMDFFVLQMIDHGVIHGDPHEGNIAYNIEHDKFVIYDLGNIITVNERFRTLIKQFIFEIMIENIDSAIQVLTKIDYVDVRDEKTLKIYLQKYVEYIKTIDIKVFTKNLNEADSKTFKKIPIKLDGIIFRLIRVFGLVEGICKDLDPDFNYNSVFLKYVNVLSSDPQFVDYKIKTDIKFILESFLKNLI